MRLALPELGPACASELQKLQGVRAWLRSGKLPGKVKKLRGTCGIRRLKEALKRQLYHREQYQKALEANQQVAAVCERSLAKSKVVPCACLLVCLLALAAPACCSRFGTPVSKKVRNMTLAEGPYESRHKIILATSCLAPARTLYCCCFSGLSALPRLPVLVACSCFEVSTPADPHWLA